MIDAIRIEADDEGWHLIIEGDVSRQCMEYVYAQDGSPLNLSLSQEVAEQLLEQVKPIAEYVADRERHRREYDAASPEERDRVLHGPACFPRDRAHAIHREVERLRAEDGPLECEAELLREKADLDRKAERERGER